MMRIEPFRMQVLNILAFNGAVHFEDLRVQIKNQYELLPEPRHPADRLVKRVWDVYFAASISIERLERVIDQLEREEMVEGIAKNDCRRSDARAHQTRCQAFQLTTKGFIELLAA